MKILRAFRVLLPVAGLILLGGCASAPCQPLYRSYTVEVYPPKPPSYRVPILYDRPPGGCEFIGRFFYAVTVKRAGKLPTRLELMEAAQAKARLVGADAILVEENEVTSKDFSCEIRKIDPPTPPDPKAETKSSDRVTGYPRTGFDTPSFTTETVNETHYSLVFDVDMIVYKHPTRTSGVR